MSSLSESMSMLSDDLALITFRPENYPSKSITYEFIKNDIIQLWESSKLKIKHNPKHAQEVNQKLKEMFTAFEFGEFEKGRDIALELRASQIKKLR